MAEPKLIIRDLRVTVGPHCLVDGVNIELPGGTITTLVGPSGAGKSTIAGAVAGALPPTHRVDGIVAAQDSIGYLPQDAAETLNPARRIGTALGELAALHVAAPRRGRRRWKRRQVADLLRQAAFPPEPAYHRRYPFEFSGGQRVRLALAAVLATRPGILVLDEPTAGLDLLSRDTLIGLLDELRRAGRTILLVTHDPTVAAELSDQVLGIRDGRVMPHVPAEAVAPLRVPDDRGPTVLQATGLRVRRGQADLVGGATFSVGAGELVGVIGESGAGKTTLGRAVAGLDRLAAGTVSIDGEPCRPLRSRSRSKLAAVQYIWQEARASFDRTRPVIDQVALTAVRLRGLARHDARDEALQLLQTLALTAGQAGRLPDDLSGGQLRRAAVARALMARPAVLICDEPTTGLDPTSAEAVLGHLDDYRRSRRAAVLVCSHDLRALLPRVDRLLVLDHGVLVDDISCSDLALGGGSPQLRRLLGAEGLGAPAVIS
ncbi:ATP-binding cassette domain-containing protein [Mycobacterium sp. 21AC1]|uniref:ABC transporter ATP-binding protein n=1 Tax=[Mycobacterium] appelbergii TaxID=2939269 RepID=UPI00293922EC|nr:ATP-binding cassette domain-containing protein [Mycobacterium sp. 21AC1]MDV3125810.1 ATP-binding cassette domain-containing protein [Mycobacterium sp. 21AC1]